ncbi:MAG: 2-amino-4-hydroxy-6-hydroxymethyldihydropteridine diphosphokinase [Paracoccaceae bacterium]|nr:2-amino-4-hydroxy-6-hydroxymethyldihydropteridine diphosphokinase [Paracoccaceae bacterium]
MTELSHLALIALGSNETSQWGTPAETVQKAMLAVAEFTHFRARSSQLYTTQAFPAGSGPDFVNAAMSIHTRLTPPELLQQLHAIESDAGRERNARWGQRTLDLDLIAVGSQICPDPTTQSMWRDLSLEDQQKMVPPGLILPHPRMQERSFVLVPLAEVAPDWEHPILQKTVAAMCAALPRADIASVKPFAQ